MPPPRWQAFWQLILARFREFIREPEALFWVYGFPLLLAVGLGIAFSASQPEPPVVDVRDGPDRACAASVKKLLDDAGLKVELCSAQDCDDRLAKGQTALYVIAEPAEIKYVYDQARSEAVLARYWVDAVLVRARAQGAPRAEDVSVSEPGSRYIDFLLPGLVGMNVMGGGLFGVGFVLVDMRVRKLFKRLMATPMRHSDFLLALLTSRLLFLIPEMLSLLVLGRLLFGVPIRGSVFTLALAIVLGASAFAGVGLLLGSRTEKTETMSGLINLVMLPMYLLSGIFFSSSRFPDAVQPIIQALPLTQLNVALRAVMLEGRGLDDFQVAWRLGALALYASVSFTLALRWFKWR